MPIEEDTLPFAQVTAKVLRRLGGKYTAVAAELEQHLEEGKKALPEEPEPPPEQEEIPLEEEIQVDIIGLSTSPSSGGAYALVLGEIDGNRRLPIIIGAFEAQAIALELEKIQSPRPMTHDLLRDFFEAIGAEIVDVLIDELRDGTFFSKIRCLWKGEEALIDSGPADAVALAVRVDAPIYVHREVMEEAGILEDDEAKSALTGKDLPGGESIQPEVSALADVPREEVGRSSGSIEGNFSNRVRDVISYSREAAIRLGHDYIGAEHLLLGIIREGEGIAVKLLRNLGCDLFKLKKAIEETVRSTGGTLTVGNIPLTRQAEKILKITYLEAKLYKSDVIGTEHLLLSLLRDDENIAAQILQQGFSTTYDAVRAELDAIISGKSSARTPVAPESKPSLSEPLQSHLKPQSAEGSQAEERPRKQSIESASPPSTTPKRTLSNRPIEVNIIGLSMAPSSSGAYALVLGEIDGNRRLPILIGVYEAQAIALELEKIQPPRPMTHDLFKSVADLFGVEVLDIVVDDRKKDDREKDTSYAKLRFIYNGEEHLLDARPSDATAIAVRFDAPIYVSEWVLEEFGIPADDEEISALTGEESSDEEEASTDGPAEEE